MTAPAAMCQQKKRPLSVFSARVCFPIFAFFCLALILRNPDVAIDYMNRGLLLCAKTVIPSLFPFMVLSELIVSGCAQNAAFSRLLSPLGRLFGLPPAGCCAVVLGLLCGFPVGAKCVCQAYDSGNLTREEAERALAFSNNPSSAFLISAVGVSLWSNRRFGTVLYAVVVGCSVISGILLRKRQKRGTAVYTEATFHSLEPPRAGIRLFTEAVRSSMSSMLLVCAYVIFFSTLVGALGIALAPLKLSQTVNTALFGLLELSGGVSAASALKNPITGAVLCAFCVGWSGLSVHCQALSVCDGKNFSFRLYFLAKLFQGVLCALVFGALVILIPDLLISANGC